MILCSAQLGRNGLIILVILNLFRTTSQQTDDPRPKIEDEEHYVLPHPKEFTYAGENGPENWQKYFKLCRGRKQSPIALYTSSAVTHHQPRLHWWYYKLKPNKMTFANNGHSAIVTGDWGEHKPHFRSSPGHDHYVFEQLHFHWGPDDDSGSEHVLNNKRYPLEMHMVHWATKYGVKEEAGKYPAGLRVVASFFIISDNNNTHFDTIINALEKIVETEAEVEIEPFFLEQLMPVFETHYITYNGSLTTPPCAETVEWIIQKDPIPISSYQVSQFRNLKSHQGEKVLHNFRPLQKLNGRTVVQIR